MKVRCFCGFSSLPALGQLCRSLVRNMSARSALDCSRGSGRNLCYFRHFHCGYVEPIPPDSEPADPGPRPQSYTPRPCTRYSPTFALYRLCWLLHCVLFCHCCLAAREDRFRVGALGAALDVGRMDIPDHWHRDWILVGLLRTGLGRFLVLGPS